MIRQHFICEAIGDCMETAFCCPHKQPHIKDERCVPKECRFGPVGKAVDCVLFNPAKPVEEPVKKPEPVKKEEVLPVKIPEKPAESAQRPVTLRKKPGRKASK
jgi:hypothetical protein